MDRQMMLLLVVMAIALLYTKVKDTDYNKKICVTIITIVMALFSGMRSWWMGDLIKYYTNYLNCNGTDWSDYVFEDYTNLGLPLFFRGAGAVGISFDLCIFIIAVFFSVALGILVYRFSPSPYWSYLMFIAMGFYIFTFSGLKQTCAMGFVIFAMMAILDNRPVRFLILVLIASVFHAPALVFLAAYPMAKKKINASYFFLIAAIIILVYFFHDQIVEMMAEAYYEEEKLYVASGGIGGRVLMMALIMVFGIVMRPLQQRDTVFRQVFNLMVVAAIIQYFSTYDNVFSRLADYYYQFIVLFLPLAMESGDHQAMVQPERRHEIRYFTHRSYLLIGLAITLFALWYYNSYIDSSQAILQDFRFFWEIDPYPLYGK